MSSQKTGRSDLIFDLYNWENTSNGNTHTWKHPNGHTINAEHQINAKRLHITVELANGEVKKLPPIDGFEPRNMNELRRCVEDTLAKRCGRW